MDSKSHELLWGENNQTPQGFSLWGFNFDLVLLDTTTRRRKVVDVAADVQTVQEKKTCGVSGLGRN
jgi:hypothetical protein